MIDDEDDPEDEVDSDTITKLDAIAHPERFTSEPGEMVADDDEEEEPEED